MFNNCSIIRKVMNPRVISAIVSAVGAIVSAIFAGCSLRLGKCSIQDFECSIFNAYNQVTNQVQVIKENI